MYKHKRLPAISKEDLESFDVPYFSVLDTRVAYWQRRKKQWISLGVIEPYTSRTSISPLLMPFSIFDPVLCEVIYRWFSSNGAVIADPFAGESTQGIVASLLKRRYFGMEIRGEQVEENRKQSQKICKTLFHTKYLPIWKKGDSHDIKKVCSRADLIFTCPPYFNLEVYSKDKNDLSNMPFEQFKKAYTEIIAASSAILTNDRFACVVISDVRRKGGQGEYLDLVGLTIKAFAEAGLSYYNSLILLHKPGSVPMTMGKHFRATRKVGRVHQNILVFLKGNARYATAFCKGEEVPKCIIPGCGKDVFCKGKCDHHYMVAWRKAKEVCLSSK